jgi:GNAT superfamily N-acetyltransferase
MLPAEICRRTPTGICIRRAEPGDLEATLALLSQLHEADAPLSRSVALEKTFDQISSAADRALLVACVDYEVVGTLDLYLLANLTRGGRPWAGIENVVVDRRERRRGIGGAMLDVALALARDAGCYKVQLISHDARDAAHALYESRAFTAPVRGYRHYFEKSNVSPGDREPT